MSVSSGMDANGLEQPKKTVLRILDQIIRHFAGIDHHQLASESGQRRLNGL